MGLELRADRDRWLPAIDPDGHALVVSCGTALRMATLALAAAGWDIKVQRIPNSDDPDLLARVTVLHESEPSYQELSAALSKVRAAVRRRSDRRPLDGGSVPQEVVDELGQAGDCADGVTVAVVGHPDQVLDIAVVTAWSDRVEQGLDDMQREIARWVRDDDSHPDGVPATAVPRASGRHGNLAQRDFEQHRGIGRLPVPHGVDDRPLVAVVLTDSDDVEHRLRAGEALLELLLLAERAGLASCPLSQPVDLPAGRARLRTLLSWEQYPQMLVRIGVPLAGSRPPLTPRRPVDGLVDDDSADG
jgi:nitroreductase